MSFLKKGPIRFNGKKEIETKIKNQTDNVIARRFKILMIFVTIAGAFLLIKLYITQITQSNYYSTKLQQYNTGVFTSDTFRGNIYDRNYNRLVYNKNINCATYYAVQGIEEKELEVIANFLVHNVNIDTSNVTTREKKDYLIMKDQEYVKTLLTPEDLLNDPDTLYKSELEAITNEILSKKLSDNDIKFYMLFYKMKSTKSGSIVLLEGLSIKEASIIGENSDILKGVKVTNDWSREYTYGNEFKQVLGRVTTKKQGLPASTKDILLAQDYNNDSRVGTSGIEAQYENILSGNTAKYSIQYDYDGSPIVKSVSSGSRGTDIRLTIDWELQEAIGKEMEHSFDSTSSYNKHIFLTLINPNNGEILAMVGKERNGGKIIDYAAGNYLNAYEIGSTFKGATIYTGFKENLITKNTYFADTASGIKIKGTPVKRSWRKSGLGNINEVQALSLSSNVYMFYIAIRLGGGHYVYDHSLNINPAAFDTLRKDAGELGLGVKTGIDLPTESLGYRGPVTSRQGGNLLDFAIGQYDTYTPIQMAQYVSTIATKGKRIQPHLFKDSFTKDEEGNNVTLLKHKVKVLDDVSSYTLAFERIQAGFRMGCVSGLARSVEGYYNAAGKTGTAQVFINNVQYTNRAFVGYAPYDNPQIAISCMSEKQNENGSSACQSLAKFAFTKYFDKYGVKSE